MSIPDVGQHAEYVYEKLKASRTEVADLEVLQTALHWSYHEGWRRAREEYARALGELARSEKTAPALRQGLADAAVRIYEGEL